MGFIVFGFVNDGINVNVMGEDRYYLVFNIIEFNFSRKRMSVIVRMFDGKIILFCKGVDSIIYLCFKKGEQQEFCKEIVKYFEMFVIEGFCILCIV